MSGFTFDAKAALNRAQKCRRLPTVPTLPTDRQAEGGKVGKVGTVGTVRAFDPEMTSHEFSCDIYEERAAIREFCGGQFRPEAERDAWTEASDAADISLISEWRREADDIDNPDNWANSPNERKYR